MSKEKWDSRFSEEGYVYGTTENEFIKKMSEQIPNQSKIGCFAEGEGRNAVYLATLGHNVTTYDQSTVGLEKAATFAKQHQVNIETVAMDLTKEKAESDQYDAAIMVFGHVPKQDQNFLIENIIQSVKSGGHIIIEVYSENQIDYKSGGPPTVDHLYNPTDILSWIKPYKCIHFYYGEAVRNEGSRHTGLGHVIQTVIQK